MASPQIKETQSCHDPAILILGIYPAELKVGTQTRYSTPMFINSICVYANTIRKRGSPSLPSQREQGDQPLVIHTDELPLIAQNVISDYIIFELLQLSLMSTTHQR